MLANLKSGKFKVTSYKKSSVVHFDGETCSKLEIILSGRVAVDRIDESGNLLTISEFYKNDILGGNLLFSKNPYYPMTVLTKLPTDILEIDREALFELFCNNPVFLRTYLELTSDRAFILGNKIKHYINKTIRESIMNYLNYESKIQNSNHIKLNTTKKALAEKIGVQRTSLSRELAKMREDGLILFDTDSITLLK
ncbi:Crp/Fnr family transcriptional regulator [Proteiniclasticum sp. QWL-01]|uniref:Crp/Fnr family transcriptional regulator n=1 Tax=Proteiniclasticum sp. QWL-01 TaxID=3036945 RepID=UPI002410E4EF|nr:Crp/Fnr family transcriptional regulator [Proteiniclasticum sp. QWL-01]WFF74591.1 Crp/Fnr family transcriptional regulator [Proteiniclasticum sp. QWL-01]